MKSISKIGSIVLLLITAFFITGAARAQKIDSLKNVLPKLKDTARIECLIKIYVEYMHKDIYDSAIYYAKIVEEESKEIDYLHGIAETYMMKAAMASRIENDPIRAEQMAREAIERFRLLKNKSRMEIAYIHLGGALHGQGKYDEALINYMQAYEISRNAGQIDRAKGILERITDVYREKGEYVKLLETQEKLIQHDREEDDNRAYTSHELWVMGLMYMLLEEYSTALPYWRQLFLSEPVWSFGTWNLTEYAQLLTLCNQPDSALYYYNLFDSARASLNDLRIFLISKGEFYLYLKDYETSLKYFVTVLGLKRQSKNWIENKRIFIDLAKTYAALEKTDFAIKYARTGLNLALESNSRPSIRDCYQILYSIYSHLGHKDSAFHYYQNYIAIKEEVMNNQTRGKLATYSYENRMQLLDKSKQLQERKISEASLQRNLLLTGIVAILIIGTILLRSIILKRKNEANRREIAENQLKLQLLESQKMKAELQQQATELEMQALRSQMNPHFIFNCLSSINSFILKNNTESASDYLTKFSRLIRMVLNNSKQKLITLQEELDCLELYLQMEQLRFKYAFQFSIRSDDLNSEEIMIPPLLLQPFAENAIWHGLISLPGQQRGERNGGMLSINITRQNGSLCCSVKDNGVGRRKAAELNKDKGTRKSLGLEITKERMKLIEFEQQNKVSLEIRDLEDEAGLALGTEVLLKIPIIQEHSLKR